jgi:hypothetical protein
MRTTTEILDEIRRIKGLDSDTALGALFNVKQSTVASWRARNSLPYEEIIAFCVKEGIPTDVLFLGTSVCPAPDPPISPRVAALVNNFEAMSEEDKCAFERIVSTVAESGKRVKKKAG